MLELAVDRLVQALQVAVDDDDQVVKLLAPGEQQHRQGLRLAHLAVADEGPDLAARDGADPPVPHDSHAPAHRSSSMQTSVPS